MSRSVIYMILYLRKRIISVYQSCIKIIQLCVKGVQTQIWTNQITNLYYELSDVNNFS